MFCPALRKVVNFSFESGANVYLNYEGNTLYYDPDGSGGKEAIAIASLVGTVISLGDKNFTIVGMG